MQGKNKGGLNPCSNGSTILGFNEILDGWVKIVLILVLMEVLFWEHALVTICQ